MTQSPPGPDTRPSDEPTDVRARVRPLLGARQFREFTAEAPSEDALRALLDVARWTGSSRNTQPWRFILLRDRDVIRQIADAGMTLTRSLQTATAAIAIAIPAGPEQDVSHAFDEGRAAERILVAAGMLGLGAGVTWIRPEIRPLVARLLALPEGWMARTVMAIGHPTPGALAPKSTPGAARRPRTEVVFEERWPASTADGPVR
jgi:nitroreductase